MNFEEISSLLPDGSIGPISLSNSFGSNVFILFYPGDFVTISREEIKELTDLFSEFSTIQCHVFACSTSTSQMHQAWMSTHPNEDHEGLGFRPPFSILGDPTRSICKKFDMYNEERDCAKHGFVLLNETGQVKYKEILDLEAKLNMVEALATVKKNVLFAEIKEKMSSKKSFDSDDESDLPEPPPLPSNPPPMDSSSEDEDDEKMRNHEADSAPKQAESPKAEHLLQETPIHIHRQPSREQIAEIETIEEDELHEIEEHHLPTTPTFTTTATDDDKENDAKLVNGDDRSNSSVSSATTQVKVEPKTVQIVVEDAADGKQGKAVLKTRMSVQDMEASLKRELSTVRKEGAPPPIEAATASAPAPSSSESGQGKKKKKEEESCCIIA